MDARNFRRETFQTIREVRLLIESVSAPIQRRHGITSQQLNVLMELDDQPGITASQLAERLGIQKPNLTPVVRRLISAGLVERTRDARDRRSHHLSLSIEGRQMMAEIDAELAEALFGLMATMPRDVFEAVISGIYAIRLFIRGVNGQSDYLLPDSEMDRMDQDRGPLLLPGYPGEEADVMEDGLLEAIVDDGVPAGWDESVASPRDVHVEALDWAEDSAQTETA